PYPMESDEVTVSKDEDKAEKTKSEDKDKKDEKAEKKEDKKKEYIHIDYDGLGDRVTRVPIEGDNYQGLVITKEFLIYGRGGTPFYGREPYPHSALVIYSLKERKETVLAENLRGFSVSDDGKKILVRSEHDFKLYEVKPEGKNN